MSSDDTGRAGMEGMEALFRGQKGDKGEPGMTRGAKHAIVYLFIFTMLLAAAGLVIGVREIAALQSEVRAECKFDADLGSAPVIVPKGLKPSLLGVTIVSDGRIAWHGHHCPGRIPAAAPSFIRWARYYKVPYK